MASKNIYVTYFLWFFGGIFGLHHFYLRRDRHAFVWFTTFGGFVFGWIRDIWRIPDYVSEANRDKNYIKEFKKEMRNNEQPTSSSFRASGASFLGYIYGTLFTFAVPYEPVWDGIDVSWLIILYPAAVAVAIHLVGNIGRQQGSLKYALIGSYVMYPVGLFASNPSIYCAFSSSWLFNKKAKKWRKTPTPHKNICKRFFIFFSCVSLYSSLWLSGIYFNGKIVDNTGETIKIKDAVHNFLKSEFVTDLKASLWQLYENARINGWRTVWEEFVDLLDPQGEKSALKTLNLTSGVTQAEITSRWRQLSREWHPDRHKDPQMKAEAHDRFAEIQSAYTTLSEIRQRRNAQNAKDSDTPH